MESVWRKSLMLLVLAIFTGHLVFGDDYAADIEKLKSQFPAGTVPDISNLTSALPIDKVLDTLKKKCSQEAGSDAAFEEAQQAATKLQECLTPLMDWNQLMEEVEVAKPTGDLETVFNKYCRRRHTALECVKNFTAATTPCLSETENSHKGMFEKMLEQLLGFVCHKDGDQIALFIAEKGPECFAAKKDEMWRCVNETYGEQLASLAGAAGVTGTTLEEFDPEKVKLPEKLPEFTVEKEQCEQLEEVEMCITKVLEQCEETTPANLFESAAKFVRNESPCRNVTTKYAAAKQRKGAAVGLRGTKVGLLLAALGVALVAAGWM